MSKNIKIGRSSSNDFVLDDEYASKEHAQFLLSNTNQVYVIDLNSKCGTTVNGRLIDPGKPYMLREYDIVRAADTLIPWKDFISSRGFVVKPQEGVQGNLDNTIIKTFNDVPQSKISIWKRIYNKIVSLFKG